LIYLAIKRFFDFVFSLVGLLILSPFFLVIIVLLVFSGDGEIFFFQERVGYRQRIFSMWKFSSMLKNSINMGSKTVTLRNDPRITPIGKYLRITKINEILQLVNVLKGDMSFVGARPLIPNSFKKYTPEVQRRIYNTRPGVTGIGSLIFRDEEKLVTEVRKMGYEPLDYYAKYIYPYKGALEMWYQDHISFTTDLMILLLTFWQILFLGSELSFNVLKSLPERPPALTLQGLQSMHPEDLNLIPVSAGG
jgi:lipopolysaccharide/colanic/teichoic acid biosynthesis glycosyltransferase